MSNTVSGETPHGTAAEVADHYEPGTWDVGAPPALAPWALRRIEDDPRPHVLIVPSGEEPHHDWLVPVPLASMGDWHRFQVRDGYVVAEAFELHDVYGVQCQVDGGCPCDIAVEDEDDDDEDDDD